MIFSTDEQTDRQTDFEAQSLEVKGHIHIKYKLVSDERSFDVDNLAYINFSYSDKI